MRVAYLDCFAGIAGDMFVGALADAGVPHSVFENAATAMNLGASLRFETVDRSGISATKAHVYEGDHLADASTKSAMPRQTGLEPLTRHPEAQHQHRIGHLQADMMESEDVTLQDHEHGHGRSLPVIRMMIGDSTLLPEVKALAIRTFELLGHSEAKIHNVDVESIHFHEVGAIDAIVDIVAASAGIVHLGIDAWYSSAVNVGGGTVRCAHGLFPVPAPATADLLRGLPTYSAHIQKELVTPTGAAVLRALSPTFGPQPTMTTDRIGYGAGTRNPPGFPNVLRIYLGYTLNDSHGLSQAVSSDVAGSGDRSGHMASTEAVTVLETALDDVSPQLLAYVAEQAYKLGALDVMLTPVIMKKGRPGTVLTVLANVEDTGKFERLLLRETTTLGLRVRQDRRICLDRDHTTVDTIYGKIRVKTGSLAGEALNAHPEFEDCRHLAEEAGVPLKRVQAAALASFFRLAEDEAGL